MNYLQLGLFLIYFFSLFCCGSRIYAFLNPANTHFLNCFIYLGETLLLGSIAVIGAMILLSLLGLYSALFLWGIVLLGYFFLFSKAVRSQWRFIFSKKAVWDTPLIIFYFLLAIFIFRNCFFLVDVDSHAIYLLTSKLWLAHKTSLIGGPAMHIGVFVPQFNAIPYALGLSIFGEELLFPQLVVVSWSVLALLLVFGYTRYRFGGYYALAATMLVLFDDHFFYSGENACCIVNGALIAFLFAAAYNFWEGQKAADQFRFVLALIFMGQLIANKYQMLYIAFFVLLAGFWVQEGLWNKLRNIVRHKLLMAGLIFLSTACLLLWCLKNFLLTGVPTFPILADRFGAFHWSPAMTEGYRNGFVGPLSPGLFFKYMNYLFIWPGIDALKIVILVISLSPLIFFTVRNFILEKEEFKEWNYWLTISFLIIFGLCLMSFVDPRHYRYGIAIFAFTAVFCLRWFGKTFFPQIPKGFWTAVVILLALHHSPIVLAQGGGQKYPTLTDNLNVILDRLHSKDVVGRYYPQNLIALRDYANYPKLVEKSAWDTGVGGVTKLSAFLLPIRPQVGLWHTTAVRWESYENPESVAKDLQELGIEWVMRVKEDKLVFLSIAEYAKEASGYERCPSKLFYNYGFPQELGEIRK